MTRFSQIRFLFLCGLMIVGLSSGGTIAQADDASHLSRSADSPATGTPLFENLGSLHHPISTSSPHAQRYFDQGLRLVFAFNHEEAVNSFQEAARQDPRAPMPYWGIALALGPNINLPMDRDAGKRAYEAIRQARAKSGIATTHEKAYIEALAARYSNDPNAKRNTLDEAYAKAMRKVWDQYPIDANAGTLYAEALMNLQPWDYWTADGEPKGAASEIVSTLEHVLSLDRDHPGACHYYIHAVEASADPERALPCAKRLADLMPGAGHLVHMPAHIYLRLGMYKEAVEHNVRASSVDHDYLAHRDLAGIYPAAYYPHNVHFLWSALMMEGRSQEARKAARDLAALVSLEAAKQEPALEEFTPTLAVTLIRFGRWQEILQLPQPPAELKHTTAIWRYARGVAYAALKRIEDARREHHALVEWAKTLPPDRVVGITPVTDLATIAERALAGEIAAREGRYDDALTALREAAALEDRLRYYEPPLWHIPVRHALGAVLLEAKRPEEAEQVYRTDLRHHPHNGWALFGLKQSLLARGKTEEAEAVDKEFQAAWGRADVKLTASRL